MSILSRKYGYLYLLYFCFALLSTCIYYLYMLTVHFPFVLVSISILTGFDKADFIPLGSFVRLACPEKLSMKDYVNGKVTSASIGILVGAQTERVENPLLPFLQWTIHKVSIIFANHLPILFRQSTTDLSHIVINTLDIKLKQLKPQESGLWHKNACWIMKWVRIKLKLELLEIYIFFNNTRITHSIIILASGDIPRATSLDSRWCFMRDEGSNQSPNALYRW